MWFFKEINFKVFFRQKIKKLLAERMEIEFYFINKWDQSLKTTSEMKTRLPFYPVSFHVHSLTSILELNSCLHILQSQTSNTSVAFNPHPSGGNGGKGFFPQNCVRIHKRKQRNHILGSRMICPKWLEGKCWLRTNNLFTHLVLALVDSKAY